MNKTFLVGLSVTDNALCLKFRAVDLGPLYTTLVSCKYSPFLPENYPNFKFGFEHPDYEKMELKQSCGNVASS